MVIVVYEWGYDVHVSFQEVEEEVRLVILDALKSSLTSLHFYVTFPRGVISSWKRERDTWAPFDDEPLLGYYTTEEGHRWHRKSVPGGVIWHYSPEDPPVPGKASELLVKVREIVFPILGEQLPLQ